MRRGNRRRGNGYERQTAGGEGRDVNETYLIAKHVPTISSEILYTIIVMSDNVQFRSQVPQSSP